MENRNFIGFDPTRVPSPSYVVDLSALKQNLAVLSRVKERSGAQILLALKAFSMFSTFNLIGSYLDGVCASSPDEARLGCEEMGKEVHSYCPAYTDNTLHDFLKYSDHIVFNSQKQLNRLRPVLAASTNTREKSVSVGLRLNPEQPEADVPFYDPSSPYSRLGIPVSEFDGNNLEGVDGFHFHNLCEQNSDALVRTWEAVERKFGKWIPGMKWINLGGGHHITRSDYDIEELVELIDYIRNTYHVDVYLEPGEAVSLNTGVLIVSVVDIIHNGMPIAVLDTSATCHMPDVLEMPYRPEIWGAGMPDEKEYTYRLGGLSCLAGDVIGDFSFDKPLSIGDRLVFTDMAHYTMVKTTTFNGVRLPSICTYDPAVSDYKVVKIFGYEDFRSRLS
ncbi:MAG: carboxynorspermidine decarboxylase [Bacteroidetes bacterium]|nr:carboxynorspermidine decarboxylase [Bacteroidota bacterium]